MQQLVTRLTSLDPGLGESVRVIAYFDTLVEGHAGLEAFIRAAAVLAGCPAAISDVERHVHVRVQPDGRRVDLLKPDMTTDWPALSLYKHGTAKVWLERVGDRHPLDAIVLERLATGARLTLDFSRGGLQQFNPALAEVLLDHQATVEQRIDAAARLGLDLDNQRLRAIAIFPNLSPPPGSVRVGRLHALLQPASLDYRARDGRVGIGGEVSVLDLPKSWDGARAALRFTADGTDDDPGPTTIRIDDLGGLALLASLDLASTCPTADCLALTRLVTQAPSCLAALEAFSTNRSLRAAADALAIHHSTLQDRIRHASAVLGWDIVVPNGRNRLHVALALRRLRRTAESRITGDERLRPGWV